MVKGGSNVGLRMFSSDIKRNDCVHNNIILDLDKVKPLLITTGSKKLEKTSFLPVNKGYEMSISNNYKDGVGIVYKDLITITSLKNSFGKLKKKSPGLDDLVKAN
jgi:hypothetical protein